MKTEKFLHFRTIFGDHIIIRGCFFHYGQCVFRNMRKHGLTLKFRRSRLFRKWMKKLMVVPLLPRDFIRPAFEQLLATRFPGFSNTDRGNFNRFCRYMTRQWLPMDPDILSVAFQDDTTNNALESHHSYLKREIKVHRPGSWTFVGKLNDIIGK